MIRVAIVDDHHAVRLGLEAAITAEPDMDAVGAAENAAEAAPLLYRTAPDVVVVDYRLPGTDGLTLCERIKSEPTAPAVLLHSAFADDWLTVPAILAGADGIVHKNAPGRQLTEAIRLVAAGEQALPPITAEVTRAGAELVAEEDRPVLAMLLHGTPASEVAEVLGVPLDDLRARLRRMLSALRAESSANV